MTLTALAKLRHRSAQLTTKLAYGNANDISASREMLRQSLVELYELGHWLQHPDEMRKYMRLYRMCAPDYVSAPPSRSVPDRTDRCSL